MKGVFMDEKNVSKLYSVSEAWLKKRRLLKNGPPFIRVNSLYLYPQAETSKWFSSNQGDYNE